MANGGIQRIGWMAGCCVAALLLPWRVAAAVEPFPQLVVDQEWRDRYVMGVDGDAYRHAGRAWAKAQAMLEAARTRGVVQDELRAAARYLLAKPIRGAEDCAMVTRYAATARAAAPEYDRELFDLGAATAWSWIERPCAAQVTPSEMEALARRLGDPARMFYVLEARVAQAFAGDGYSEMTALRAKQLDYAIAGFQRAAVLMGLTDTEMTLDPNSTASKRWLDRAAREFDPEEYQFHAVNLESNLAIIEFRANNLDAGMEHVQRAVQRLRAGAALPDYSAMNLISFSNHLIRLGRTRQALDLLRESLAYELTQPNARISRASVFLSAYTKLRTPEAFAEGEKAVAYINEIFNTAPETLPRRPTSLKQIAQFYESFGKYEQAYRAQQQVVAAMEDTQKRSNETTRVELQEKLDVALKDQENTRLKAEAELQAERQRGWIVGFVAVAVGAVAAAAALGIAVRRGRRLAKVSAELADRNHELEQRSASRIRLLAAACHDLRQPAHALGMLAELGSDANAEPTRYTAWLQSVRRSTASLGDMLDELMDLGRLDGGHYTPHLSDVSLGELLQEVMLHFGPLARRKGLTLEAPPVNFLVVSDRHLLRRMLFNLVSNAIKYTDTGTVRVMAAPSGGEVSLSVQDTGPGIPQDKLDDVFRDYVRLNPLKAAEGLGIGLSIVRRSADLLGHRLTLASPPGEGTTVTLSLPISTAAMATEPGETPADAVAAASGVLVVLEDDTDVRDAMAGLLRRWHYTVFAAPDADAALADLARMQAHPSLVITDLHLGATDGLQEVARLREALQAPGLPALLVTGDLDATVAGQAAAAHVFVAHKPLAPRKLAELVGQLAHADAAANPSTADAPAPAPLVPR